MAAYQIPKILTRADWNCPVEIPASVPEYTHVTHLIIHHTAIELGNEDFPEVVRRIWELHVRGNGWDDIGYNLVIDPDGRIYEGRAGGDGVQGAHFICANENTMGVAMIGEFEEALPAESAVDSLIRVLAWKCKVFGIDPLGVTFHEPTGLELANIAGHRDGNSAKPDSDACPANTVCPGERLYELLPEIRMRVSEIMRT
jgi:hypothetical protein